LESFCSEPFRPKEQTLRKKADSRALPVPLCSFIWSGPNHHLPFKSSRNTAANRAGGGGSVAKTEEVFGDSMARGFRGAPQIRAWMCIAIHLWPCKLKLITCHFTKLLPARTLIQKWGKGC
ncbi:mCG145997, isoform CRA_b, partial [Mus musculus]